MTSSQAARSENSSRNRIGSDFSSSVSADHKFGLSPAEFASIFDTRYDDAFENILKLLEGILGDVVIRIGFLSGKHLVSRIENFSDPAVPTDLPIGEYPCGIAVKNRVAMECRNAQEDEVLSKLPKVVECGVKYYASQFITARGGQIIGMFCTYSREEKSLSEDELIQFESVAKTTGHLVEAILDSLKHELGRDEKAIASHHSIDFTSLFELSPLPTAVMTYPRFEYVAANGPMGKELSIFFDQESLDREVESRRWVAEFHSVLKAKGVVENFEMEVTSPEEGDRFFLMDGRFWQTEGEMHVLVTARDITGEKMRERKLQLLLEVTNIEVGDDWFRTAAESIAELVNVECVTISELTAERELVSHAVWKEGIFEDNFSCDNSGNLLDPVYDGDTITLTGSEIPSDSALAGAGQFCLHGIPVKDSSDEAVGLITLGSSHPIHISEDIEMVFKLFVSRAAAEIARLNFDRSREAELRRITMLQRISQAISNCANPDQVLNIAAEEIGKVFGVSRCVIHRRESGGGFPVVAEYVDGPFLSMINVQVPRKGNRHAEEVMSGDTIVAVSDVFKDSRFSEVTEVLEKFEIRSMMSARTSFEYEANGAIGLQQCGDKIRNWTAEEESLLGAVVANIGVAIAQANLTERERLQRSVIEEALQNAKAASKAKGDFLARMSHELRTPMNSILGFSQLLSEDENLTDEQRETLKIVNRSGEHLMILINDVLEMSKIESGKQDVNLSTFSPRKLVEGLSEMFAIRAASKGLSLDTDIPESLPECIEGDESKLRQIITNLVGNAIKFTAQGSVKLKCWYFRKDESDEKSGILAFSITDSGCGMTGEEQEKLFTPFTQTRAGIDSCEGTGLGLAISKSFVELLGGELKVESEPGEGSKFIFSVDCREVDTVEGETISVHCLPDTKSFAIDRDSPGGMIPLKKAKSSTAPTVLIADDQPENRLLAVKLLSSAGYTLLEAVDGQDAIDACRAGEPDAILMDVRMPGTDGLAATRTIREMSELKKQPFIIALTGNAFEDDRKLASRAGCDDFLAKPFRIGDLLEMLTEKIGRPESGVEESGRNNN